MATIVVCAAGDGGAATVKLTAERAAARAVEVSNVIAAADSRLAAAEETVKSAGAASLPYLSLGASVAQLSAVPEFKIPINNPPLPPTAVVIFPSITTSYATGVRMQQALYAGGAITGGRDAARHDADASSANRGATAADIRLGAQLAYWEAARTAAGVEVARAQEDRARRLLEDTRALFDAGMAVKVDVLAAEERIASARVQVISAQVQADNALATLRSLLHLDRADRIELSDSLSGPLPSVPGALEDLQEQALATRPEMAAFAAQVAALRSREQVASAPSRPSLGAVAEYDYNRPNQRFVPPTDQWQSSWSVALLASWTLFDGGKASADSATVRFVERATVQEKDELARRILLDVETGRHNLESALSAVEAADLARATGVEREKAATERHAAGLAPMVDILDAQSQLAAAEEQQVNARAASWIAAAILARAVGR